MKDDSGNLSETDEDGYDLKREQVEEALTRLGAPGVPTLFFNAISDDPVAVSERLVEQVKRVRTAHELRIAELCQIGSAFLGNQETELLLAAQREVSKRVGIFTEQREQLPKRRRPAQDALLDSLSRAHPRTLWASVRRSGAWYNFDVQFHLGRGAVVDARMRSSSSVEALHGILENATGDHDLSPAVGLLVELRAQADEWEERFLAAVRNAGEQTFRPRMADAVQLWSECESLYGTGPGFREEVGRKLSAWFEADDQAELHDQLEETVQALWSREVLDPLRRSTLDNSFDNGALHDE